MLHWTTALRAPISLKTGVAVSGNSLERYASACQVRQAEIPPQRRRRILFGMIGGGNTSGFPPLSRQCSKS